MAKVAQETGPRKLYKVLVGGKSCHGGDMTWSLPKGKKPGEWHAVDGDVIACQRGLHLTPDPAAWWKSRAAAYLVEAEGVEGDPDGSDKKVVAKRVRLMRKLTPGELAAFGLVITPGGASAKSYPKDSNAYLFLCAAWHGCNHQSAAWATINSTMASALGLAITGGMSFNPDDFDRLWKSFRCGHWIGESLERWYAAAVAAENISACQAYETYVKRVPFMYGGGRIAEGSSFDWSGLFVTITSFAKDGLSFIVCSYKPETSGSSRAKIDRRITITLDELRAAEKIRKEAERVARDVTAVHDRLTGRNGRMVPAPVVAKWAQDQRDAARAWANDAKRTHKPATMPPHVTQGYAFGAELAAAENRWRSADFKQRPVDYLAKGSALLAFVGKGSL